MSEVQKDLADSNVHLIKLYVSGEHLFVWFLAPGSKLRAWEATPALSLLDPVMAALFRDKPRPPWSGIETSLADFWTALMPADVREYILNNRGRLLFLPHRQLCFAPFAAIPQQSQRPLGENWEVATAPSAGAFLQLDQRRDPEDTPALAFGPYTALAIGGIPERTVDVPLILGRPEPCHRLLFPALDFSSSEANRVIELLGGKSLIGPEATRDAVLAAMPSYRLIHFAAHGYWAPGGGVSLLVLSDATLGFPYVIEVPMKADLVVLSACQTGLGEPQPDSFTGIAQDFLIAGARSVLTALWPINDSATLFFMDKFYLSLVHGASPAAALGEAQQAMRENPDLSDGYRWAGFQLAGRPFASSSAAKFDGPIFCGGDFLQNALEPGSLLDLTALADFVQSEGEAAIYSPKGFSKIQKHNL